MPSYRTIMTVTTLAPGRAPEEVEAAARSVTRLESWDIAIASGQPRVTARFTAIDDAEARAPIARFSHPCVRSPMCPAPAWQPSCEGVPTTSPPECTRQRGQPQPREWGRVARARVALRTRSARRGVDMPTYDPRMRTLTGSWRTLSELLCARNGRSPDL